MGSSPIQAFQVRGWLTEVLIDHDMLKTTYQGDLFFFDFGSGAKALRVLYLFLKDFVSLIYMTLLDAQSVLVV
jgi:hypothetical protein